MSLKALCCWNHSLPPSPPPYSQELGPKEVVIDIYELPKLSPSPKEEQSPPHRSRLINWIPGFFSWKSQRKDKVSTPTTENPSDSSTPQEGSKIASEGFQTANNCNPETVKEDNIELENIKELAKALQKMKKKEKKTAKDDDDDSDDESYSKKAPSKKKVMLMTLVFASATFAAMYFKLNPVVTVPIAGLFGTNVKTFTRRVPRKPRYIILVMTTISGWGLDILTGSRFSFAPVATSVLLSSVSRTQKLFVLGKMEKDK